MEEGGFRKKKSMDLLISVTGGATTKARLLPAEDMEGLGSGGPGCSVHTEAD